MFNGNSTNVAEILHEFYKHSKILWESFTGNSNKLLVFSTKKNILKQITFTNMR